MLFSELNGFLANKVKDRYPTLLFITVPAFIRSFRYIQNSATKKKRPLGPVQTPFFTSAKSNFNLVRLKSI